MEGAAWPAVVCLPGPGLPRPTVAWLGRQPGQPGSPATRAQASLYTCQASNRLGTSSAAITVEILAPPTCEWRPPRLTAVPQYSLSGSIAASRTADGKTLLRCRADAEPGVTRQVFTFLYILINRWR